MKSKIKRLLLLLHSPAFGRHVMLWFWRNPLFSLLPKLSFSRTVVQNRVNGFHFVLMSQEQLNQKSWHLRIFIYAFTFFNKPRIHDLSVYKQIPRLALQNKISGCYHTCTSYRTKIIEKQKVRATIKIKAFAKYRLLLKEVQLKESHQTASFDFRPISLFFRNIESEDERQGLSHWIIGNSYLFLNKGFWSKNISVVRPTAICIFIDSRVVLIPIQSWPMWSFKSM